MAPKEAPLPRQFGKYVLTRKIAMGGMAEIYKGKTAGAEGFEKDIVIKRILPHFTEDENFVKMFIDEATITSKLQHSNIVQIFDFDMCENSYYIAMEFVEGVDLKDVIDKGVKEGTPLSVAQCVYIMMELGKGLHYAHMKEHKGKPLNIVHRDISPHNAMVSYNAEVKLMDFGIAKAAQRSTKTMAGTVKGKVAYMSPEQARGKPLDGRSDLFAVGIILWEMLTNKRLFLGDSDFETLTNVLKAEAPAPSSINPDVPQDLDLIILKTLEKDRDQRYPTVEAFNRELTRWYYANVTDLEKEALKPFMRMLFADNIAKAQSLSEKEAALPKPAADPDRTVAISAADDPHAAATLLDDGSINQQQVQQALMAQQAGATVAMPIGQGTGTFTGQGFGGYQQQPAKGKGLLIALIALLVLGGGGAAAYFVMAGDKGGGGDGPSIDNPAEMAELTLKVTPHTAKVTVDGQAVDGTATDLELNSNVRVVAEAPGFERYEEIVKLDEKNKVFEVELVPKGKPITVAIQPEGDPKAQVSVNGKVLGSGTQAYQGMVGDKVKVSIKPSYKGAEAVEKELVLKEGETILKIKIEGMPATAATLSLKINPSGATVGANVGTVTMTGDGAAISGIPMNTAVEVTVSKSGYVTKKQSVTMTAAEQSDSITLSKRATDSGSGGNIVRTGGKGKIKVNAKPWAQILVNGKPMGTTPRTLQLSAGSHKVVLMKGQQTKTIRVTVKANATKSVFHDFSK